MMLEVGMNIEKGAEVYWQSAGKSTRSGKRGRGEKGTDLFFFDPSSISAARRGKIDLSPFPQSNDDRVAQGRFHRGCQLGGQGFDLLPIPALHHDPHQGLCSRWPQ